jgi:hypothetical protein
MNRFRARDALRRVRRLIAVVMLVLFATLVGVDALCCPDGCTGDTDATITQPRPASADGACILCLRSFETAAHLRLLECDAASDRSSPRAIDFPDDAFADPVEHPPRKHAF